MKHTFLLLIGLTLACAQPDEPRKGEAAPQRRDVPKPDESNPLRQGFTQRPSPDTPGLPPPIPPLLNDDEAAAAAEARAELNERDVAEAQATLETQVRAFETDPSTESLQAVGETAVALVRQGRVLHRAVVELYADYLFPNPEDEANAKYQGKLAVFSGTVAPHNMRDFADGFKLIEQNPYIHDPLLLATDYELSFVECRLVQPDFQPLRDWQPIHFLAEVRGKRNSDLLLDHCVVLR